MRVYCAKLYNDQGCKFDEEYFTSIKEAKKWAKRRNGEYKLILMFPNSEWDKDIVFKIKNDRFYKQK